MKGKWLNSSISPDLYLLHVLRMVLYPRWCVSVPSMKKREQEDLQRLSYQSFVSLPLLAARAIENRMFSFPAFGLERQVTSGWNEYRASLLVRLFGGAYSHLTLASVLRDPSWRCLQDHMWWQGIKLRSAFCNISIWIAAWVSLWPISKLLTLNIFQTTLNWNALPQTWM